MIGTARLAFAAAAGLFAASCVSVLPEADPASARFLVSPAPSSANAGASVAWTLGVDAPAATLAYDTAKIALTRSPARIEYYAGGEWVDRAPRLFGVALVQSFENTGRIKGVGDRLALPVSSYVLQTDIRSLTAMHENGGVRADVVVFARLTNARSVIYASKLFTASEPAGGDNAASVASALNAALMRVESEIVAWTFDAAGEAHAAKAAGN